MYASLSVFSMLTGPQFCECEGKGGDIFRETLVYQPGKETESERVSLCEGCMCVYVCEWMRALSDCVRGVWVCAILSVFTILALAA